MLCGQIIKPTCLSGVYHQSSILLNFSKRIPYQQFLVCYSSNPCDSGKSGKSSSQGSGSGKSGSQSSCSDKSGAKGSSGTGGKGGDDPCEPVCCTPCPENNPSTPTPYDLRKYGHCLPQNNVNVYFEPLPHIPTGIFRNTDTEVLGLGAGKCCLYKNPEYFSFHHMSYYDMHLILRCYRKPSPNTGRKP